MDVNLILDKIQYDDDDVCCKIRMLCHIHHNVHSLCKRARNRCHCHQNQMLNTVKVRTNV